MIVLVCFFVIATHSYSAKQNNNNGLNQIIKFNMQPILVTSLVHVN